MDMLSQLIVLEETALKDQKMDVGTGAIYAVVSILIVFCILLLIIGITYLIFKITGLWTLKAELEKAKKSEAAPVPVSTPQKVVITDPSMMAAVLVATIACKASIPGDVRVVSVKEITK